LPWNGTGKRRLERILVATSGSPASRAAVELAVELASAEGAELTVLLVVPTGDPRVDTVQTGPIGHAVSHHLSPPELDQPLKEARALARERGVACRLELVAANDPVGAIVAEARAAHADLVVMGASHRRLSKAARVLRELRCPVLLATTPAGARNAA
jgi:nucleotide-binding universal stress UspA family protein